MSAEASTLRRFDATAAWDAARAPLLSILIPTFDHDVVPLCAELLAGVARLPVGEVEILVLIDGNPALAGQSALLDIAERLALPAALALAANNLGRSMARNALAHLARGRFLQFLDADSMPDSADFVSQTVNALRAVTEDVVICGGRTGTRMARAPRDARLFERHSEKREWISAEARNQDPAACFLSANFVVSRRLFLAEPFDETFRGWGWEDTEWALRISAHASIRHIDNTVSHMEHHRDAVWLGRLGRAAENYALLFARHPDAVRKHRIFPLIRKLQPLNGAPA